MVLAGEQMVLCSYEIALQSTLVDGAALVDLTGMARDEEIGVDLEYLLLCGKQKLLWLLQKEPVTAS